jgi:hypothetical protein
LLAVVVTIVAGCGAAESTGDTAAPSTAAPTTTEVSLPAKALTVDQMAATLGCVPKPMVKAADFRQVNCVVPKGKLVLLDFDTVEGMRAWLDTAQLYGGVYLVGDRWALSADTVEYMEDLRTEWGGTIEGRR